MNESRLTTPPDIITHILPRRPLSVQQIHVVRSDEFMTGTNSSIFKEECELFMSERLKDSNDIKAAYIRGELSEMGVKVVIAKTDYATLGCQRSGKPLAVLADLTRRSIIDGRGPVYPFGICIHATFFSISDDGPKAIVTLSRYNTGYHGGSISAGFQEQMGSGVPEGFENFYRNSSDSSDQHPNDAAYRGLEEELGIHMSDIQQLGLVAIGLETASAYASFHYNAITSLKLAQIQDRIQNANDISENTTVLGIPLSRFANQSIPMTSLVREESTVVLHGHIPNSELKEHPTNNWRRSQIDKIQL